MLKTKVYFTIFYSLFVYIFETIENFPIQIVSREKSLKKILEAYIIFPNINFFLNKKIAFNFWT